MLHASANMVAVFGRVPYTTADFDILLVSLLDKSDRLVGLFVFPSFDLAEHKLLGQRTAIPLYPPWSPPKFPAIARKHGWKLDYFVDLRSWKGKDSHLDPATKTKLAELLKKLQVPVQVEQGSTPRTQHLAATPGSMSGWT